MVAVPVTSRNTVERQPLGQQRFRYDAPRNFVGPAIEDAGRALGRAAETFDAIAASKDEAGAKTLDVEAMTRLNEVKLQYKANRGLNADSAYPDTEKAVNDIREDLLSRADTPRMRNLLGQVLQQRTAMVLGDIGEHRATQVFEAKDGASVARAKALAESAIAAGNPEERETNLTEGLAEIATRGASLGLGNDEIALQQMTYRSNVDASIIRNMVDADDVDGAVAYRANRTLTAADDAAVDKMLRDPLETRQADSDLTELLTVAGAPEAKPGAVVPEVAGPKQDAIRTAATELGVSPVELAAIASFEGRLNPKTVGGDGGRYEGMFQFGPEERKKYKIDRDSSFEEQVSALVRFAKDRGFKPGMGWQKLYTTINAGNPHAPVTARDSNGSQTDHYKKIESQHFAAGAAFVGGRMTGGEATSGADLEKIDGLVRAKVASGEWSHERGERVRERANRQVSAQNAIRSQVESDALRSAQEVIDNLPGNKLTSMTQIPAEVRAKLSPAHRLQLEADIAQNNKPQEPKAGSDRYFDLLDMSLNPARQKEFLALNPLDLRIGISNEEYTRLRTDQTQMKNGVGGKKKQLEMGRVYEAVNRVAPIAGVNLDGVAKAKKPETIRLRNQFVDRMVQAIRARGGEVSDTELDGIARSLAQEVYSPTTGENAPLFRQTGRVQVGVPNSFMNELRTQLQRAGRPMVSTEEARALWIRAGAPE